MNERAVLVAGWIRCKLWATPRTPRAMEVHVPVFQLLLCIKLPYVSQTRGFVNGGLIRSCARWRVSSTFKSAHWHHLIGAIRKSFGFSKTKTVVTISISNAFCYCNLNYRKNLGEGPGKNSLLSFLKVEIESNLNTDWHQWLSLSLLHRRQFRKKQVVTHREDFTRWW